MSGEQAVVEADTPPRALEAEAWHRLLAALDPDPRRAASRYQALRGRLIRLFQNRGLGAVDDLADETLDRVARRMGDGLAPRDVAHYAAGVARLVALEAARGAQRFEHYSSGLIRPPPPDDDAPQQEDRRACLDRCLGELPSDARTLLLRYQEGQRSGRISQRRALAEGLGIPINALRIRVHRLRQRVEACLARCADGDSVEPDAVAR
jgi:DNA-directed RNA polymerase specialized sigma24 family protein